MLQPATETFSSILITPFFQHHPDFWEGFKNGQMAFEDGSFFPEDDKRWTEEDTIHLVNEELSAKTYQRSRAADMLHHFPPFTYLHTVGFVIGYLSLAVDHVPEAE